MDLFLIRHGRSTWNAERRIQGHQNPRLAPEGFVQADAIARRMIRDFGPCSKKTDALVASPLHRARQTAEIVGRTLHLSVGIRKNMREAALGEWEGRCVEDIRKTDRRRLELWYRDPTRVRLKGGEPIPKFRMRIRREIRELLRIHKSRRRLILVTHGGWISTLLTDVVGIPLGRMWTFVLDNGSLTRLHWDGKKLFLRSFNEPSGILSLSAGASSFRPPERLA